MERYYYNRHNIVAILQATHNAPGPLLRAGGPHNAVLKCGQWELDLVKRYATHDYDSVLELYYAKARFYDAHDRRFTAVDPILDPSQYDLREYVQNPVQLVQYLYVQNSPLIYVDYLGMFLSGTVLTEGAIGDDIERLNYWLYRNGYLNFSSVPNITRFDNPWSRYGSYTTEAVKAFQQENELNTTGVVNKVTWEKMGFSVNSTIAEEFFSGKRGNDVISLEVVDNKVTINYFPTLYVCNTTYETVPGGRGEFSELTSYSGASTDDVYNEYEKRIIAGINQWAQPTGNISIQGVDIEVVVNVKVTHTKTKAKANFIVRAGDYNGDSITKSAILWNYNKKPHVDLADKGYYNGIDMVKVLTSHEFGHVLGVFDAYGYKEHFPLGNVLLPPAPGVNENDVMYSGWIDKYEYDQALEMVLYAWTNNKLQLYTQSIMNSVGGEISQAFYR